MPAGDRGAQSLAEFRVGTATEWEPLVRDFNGIGTRAVFRSLPPALVDKLERRARARNPRYVLGTLPRFLTAEPGDDRRGPAELAERLARLSGVSGAWVEEVGPPPVVLPVANPRWAKSDIRPGQGYLRRSPEGTDAEHAWAHPGGDGSGIGFVDVEEGWTLTHEDLVGHGAMLLRGINRPESCGHGTSVLGIVCATDDHAAGCVGFAPNLRCANVASYVDAIGEAGDGPVIAATSISDAIAVAASSLWEGDVLLVEAQVYGPDKRLCPVELLGHHRAAIRCAVDAGVVVIEAGGNGDLDEDGVDLDSYSNSNGKRVLARGSPEFKDSGAILVSAAAPGTRERIPWAPYGKRIDCWAWGAGIVTSNSVMTQSGPDEGGYRANFAGTSGAAAIVAGAVVTLQGVVRAWRGAPLAPEVVRDTLRNDSAGTAASTEEPIGRMPDLRAILETVLKVPFVYIRDHPEDDGSPHEEAVDSSPDILILPASAPVPDADSGETQPENAPEGSSGSSVGATEVPTVVRGLDHVVYIRLRNRGGEEAANVVVDAYSVTPDGVVSVSEWSWIGRVTVDSLPKGDAPVFSQAISWPAGDLPAAGDRLLVAVVGTATTPPALPPSLVVEANLDYLVRATGLVAVRSVAIVEPPAP